MSAFVFGKLLVQIGDGVKKHKVVTHRPMYLGQSLGRIRSILGTHKLELYACIHIIVST